MKKRLHDGSLKNSEASASEYGVFLSFRGPDSRQGLADVLYSDMTTAGIRVFRDNDELEVGDKISKILPAIKNSKICVPIFSETFAASVWCLREVEAMVKLGKLIMPVFYTASPDDVKLRTELFKEDLRKHEEKHGSDQVKKWEDALKAVGKIIGREVKTTGFAEFSKLIVRALLLKLKVKTKYVTDFLVKRDDQERAVTELLDVDSSDVRLVGVHGMGGVGKTTLAKVIFNALWAKFECSSFLENVQESLRRNGAEYLQKRLLEGLDPKLKHFQYIDPIVLLRKKFRHRKVLIILDDVNERKQVEMIGGVLNWFAPGSRIIVTTRDRRVFTKEARAFEVRGMNYNEALQLFSRRAFGKDSPPSDYQILSNEVIRCTGRLPLALEVMGSLLQGCEEKTWKATIEKLKKVPNRNVQKTLKLSFDALEYEHKQIFLDISCFFINKETSSASYMWEACGLFPDEGIEVLVSMSLLKIQKNEFRMHDSIRDLGRALIREECPDEPAKRSRIWSQEEALEVLKIKKGKETVEGLFLEEHGGGSLTNEQFSSFRKLRLLKLVDMKLAGDFDDLLLKLKWFSWHRCTSDITATNISLNRLVVLDLSWSSIDENWTGWSIIQMAKNLKVLDVTRCCNLTTTPDLSNNTALERLILKGCRRLSYIHSSIGKLKRLKYLDLEGCSSLRDFPKEFGSLEDLEVISVEGNDNIFHLPESIGNMRSLSVIKLQRVKITRIPSSIGGLVNLVSLSMSKCTGLKKLPDAIGDMRSLVDLDLSDTDLRALPDSVGRLVKLQSLELSHTELEELPDTLGDLKSLVRLNLSCTELSTLPNSVGRLVKLQSLYLGCTELEELPDTLGNLKSLVRLYLSHTKVKVLPDCVGQLVNLMWLDLGWTETEVLPDAIGYLQSLVQLDLSQTKISVLPDFVRRLAKLQRLCLSGTKVKMLHDSLGDMSELTELWMEGCKIRELPSLIWKLSKLKKLGVGRCDFITEIPKEIGSLSALRELRLTGSCITKLAPTVDEVPRRTVYEDSSLEEEVLQDSTFQEVENSARSTTPSSSGLNSILQLMSTLRNLTLSYITSETRLPDFSNLKNLTRIEFKHSSFPNNVDQLEGLRELRWLRILNLENCSKELVYFCCQLDNLRNTQLLIRGHETVLDFPSSLHLRSLHVQHCDELVEVRGLEKLKSLTSLEIYGCHSLEKAGSLSESRTLSHLIVRDCPKLREIEGINKFFFKSITIEDCKSLRNIDELTS